MKRGRKPKPTILKLAAGNPGKRPINESEAKPQPNTEGPPDYLDAYGLEFWTRYEPMLRRLGVMTEADREALALAAVTYSEWRTAGDVIAKEGVTQFTDKGNQYAHPCVSMRTSAAERLRKLIVEFGMTPSSRTRIHASGEPEDDIEVILRNA